MVESYYVKHIALFIWQIKYHKIEVNSFPKIEYCVNTGIGSSFESWPYISIYEFRILRNKDDFPQVFLF